jgi:hypothetical protein
LQYFIGCYKKIERDAVSTIALIASSQDVYDDMSLSGFVKEIE